MTPTVISLLFSAGIALLPFGAMYWPEALGTLAASPGLLLILAAVLLAPFVRQRERPIFQQLKLKRLLWMPVLGSVVSLGVFGWNPLFAGKFFSVGLLSLIWLSPLLLVDYLRIRHLRMAALVGVSICATSYLLSDLLHAIPGVLRNLVFSAAYVDLQEVRPRGFTEEPSQFSATFSRLIIIYYLIWESTRRYSSERLIVFLCGLSVLLVALGSKGAVTGIALALLSFTVGRRQLPYLVLALPIAWWLVNTQLAAISVDVEQFSSTSTRMTLLLTSLVSTAANPLGWGYYGFYGAMQSFGGWSLDWIGDRFPVLLFEVRDIIEELNNVSTKSTTLDFMMMLGWLFIWLMVRIVQLTRFDDPRVRASWVYILMSSLTTGGHLSITVFLAFAVMLRLYPARDRVAVPVVVRAATA
ncbi:hypothetical protein CLD22_11025 [Rubrivivax gelatinosus]|nr:hypothetical protein [Rubrivivax gelatinosus]